MKHVLLFTLTVLTLASIATAQTAQVPPQAYRPGNGVTTPRLKHEVKPVYPPQAMNSGISGLVRMECVIQPDGTISDVKVVESLDPVVDAEAVRALKQWTFTPGFKDGKAVPVIVEIEMSFSMVRGPRLGSSDVFQAGPGVILPVATESPRPDYPDAARSAGIRGSVTIDCVVLTDGTVGDARVSKPLDRALDAQAMKTLRRWRFHPGTKDGVAVPVQVSIEMTFDLR